MSQPENESDRVAALERKVHGLRSLLADMAEDKASLDRALQAEQKRHESLVARVPWVVVRLDGELRYADTNHAFEFLLGRGDLLDRPLGDSGEWDAWVQAIEEFHAATGVMSEEREIELDVDGEPRSLLVCFSRTHLDDHITVVGVDQTDRRSALESAEREAQRADAASRAKTEFLAVMSHEIRTPLNGVLGMVELLAGSKLDDKQRELARALEDSGRALHLLIDDILDLTKIDAGGVDFESIPFSPREAVRGIVDLFRARASSRGLALEVVESPGCPNSVLGDPTRLRQVLSNLVSNAIKFTESGGVSMRMRSTEEGELVRLHFEVEDTGIGIREEQAEELFGAFSQASRSTTRKYGGTGLGLAISRRLVSGMGGSISIERSPGGGALVRFDIAVEPTTELPHDDEQELDLEALESEIRGMELEVLVAEDNPVNQLIARSFLQNLGVEVTVVSDGSMAVEAVQSGGTFDLVLMDVDMPVLDGIEATRRIRSLGGDAARTPVLAMTANVVKADREACFEAGMGGWLGKPFTRPGMAKAIQTILRDHQLQQG